MHAHTSTSCLHASRLARSSGTSQSLKRRSLQPSLQPVRKGDIRRVAGDAPERAALAAFVPAQGAGSGDADDLCYQRLEAWLRVVENYREYFQSMAAAELDLATVYARIGDILKVPVHEGALLLPVDGNGIQGVTARLKSLQQLMVENHCAISRAAKHNSHDELRSLQAEVQELRDAYAASMRALSCQLAQCKASIARRTQLLQVAISAASKASERDTEVVKDPFIINLEIEALLRKQAETENRLFAAAAAQQERIRSFEPQLVARLSMAVGEYIGVVSERHKQLRLAAKRDARAIERIDGTAEWAHFGSAFADVLAAPQGTTGLAKAPDYVYPGKNSEWVKVLRQGVVALKEHGPLFRSTWQSKYGVLTTRGYFHVFRSQGDVVRGAPETSIFLPRARIAPGRDGTLQISSGSRFSRCRVVLQDSTASLDNWRLLMDDICHRSAKHGPRGATTGLATPPDSGSDESLHRCVARGTRGDQRQSVRPREARRRTMLALSLATPASAAATPTRAARPFSADASMLAQTPTPFARLGQYLSFTPTQNIYMQPLAGTPGAAAAAAAADGPSPARLSPAGSICGDSRSYEAYSPSFSDTPDGGTTSIDAELRAAACRETSSSDGPGRPGSPFEPGMSQDSESAPIGSLPQLHSTRQPSRSFQEPFPAGDGDDAASLGSFDAASRQWRGSIVDLQRPRLYSSSTGVMPAAHGFSQDIWRADLLAVPDPAMRISSGVQERPRSMICGAAPGGGAGDLDPRNPYLGEFLARRQQRDTRVGSRAAAWSAGASPPPPPPDPSRRA
ncbi:hypothetical protein LPJ61_000491 [Coemansia biformis]|uniref:PH domain-containing protein n=1 Tax=Coemansia biformis TaxID=1286918 RepID=A0A9W7YGM3_9FUNG|nr:hypothetical protein LPJ61_000491 [Coemansia biformis]